MPEDMLLKDTNEGRSDLKKFRGVTVGEKQKDDVSLIAEIRKVEEIVQQNFFKLKASKDREIKDLRKENERLTEALRRSIAENFNLKEENNLLKDAQAKDASSKDSVMSEAKSRSRHTEARISLREGHFLSEDVTDDLQALGQPLYDSVAKQNLWLSVDCSSASSSSYATPRFSRPKSNLYSCNTADNS